MTVKYTGGAYFPGIPARDLTDEEFAVLSETMQQALLDSGLYVQEAAAPARAKKAATPAPAETSTGG